jgi:DNA-binding response OmpR family regulator
LSRTEARILAYLLERSFASWSQLHLLCGEAGEVNVATLRVFLHRLRSKLRRAGVATTLKTLRGQGVLLLMAAETPLEETQLLPRAA